MSSPTDNTKRGPRSKKAASKKSGVEDRTQTPSTGAMQIQTKTSTTLTVEKKTVAATHARKPSLTPSEAARLKTGRRANIFVGPKGDSFIGIENAYVSLLCHHWGFARKQLVNDNLNALFIENASKSVVQWIYLYMAAGGKDAQMEVRLKNLSCADLCDLHHHANYLEYEALMRRSFGLLRSRIHQDGLPGTTTVRKIYQVLPELATEIISVITDRLLEPSTIDYGAYAELAQEHECFANDIDQTMEKRLSGLIASGKRYYNKIGPSQSRRVLGRNLKSAAGAVKTQGHVSKDSQQSRRYRKGTPQSAIELPPASDSKNTEPPTMAPETTGAKPERRNRRGQKKSNATVQQAELTRGHTRIVDNTSPDASTPYNDDEGTKNSAKKLARLPPICYYCNYDGHIARNCPVRETAEIVDNPRLNGSSGRNKHRRRAQQDRFEDRVREQHDRQVVHMIQVVSNGGGLRTSDQEAKKGEWTRTGLRI